MKEDLPQDAGGCTWVVGPDLAPRLTKRGFLMFRAEGKRKKDLAYAALYGLSALLSLLMDP